MQQYFQGGGGGGWIIKQLLDSAICRTLKFIQSRQDNVQLGLRPRRTLFVSTE